MHYHIPKPFFRKNRNRWYVQLDGRQINFGPDREAAFAEYYRLMADLQSSTASPPAPPPELDQHFKVAVLAGATCWGCHTHEVTYVYRRRIFLELGESTARKLSERATNRGN